MLQLSQNHMDGLLVVEITTLAVTVIAGLIAGSIRFGSMENRIAQLEDIGPRVELIGQAVARIEGRMQESDKWTK